MVRGTSTSFERKGWDSNPRAAHHDRMFSRHLHYDHSATLPSAQVTGVLTFKKLETFVQEELRMIRPTVLTRAASPTGIEPVFTE